VTPPVAGGIVIAIPRCAPAVATDAVAAQAEASKFVDTVRMPSEDFVTPVIPGVARWRVPALFTYAL